MASLTSKNGVWWAVFTKNYKQKWIKIGKMSKSTAKGVLRKLEVAHDKKELGIVEEKQIPFVKYAEQYLEYSRTNKAHGTYVRDKTSLKNLLRFFASLYLPRITSRHIETFKTKRLDEGVSPRTVNIELRCLSHMFNKALDWNYLRMSPFKGVKLLKYEKKPPRFLTKEELTRLLEAASSWLKPIIVVMVNTGIRDGERSRLRFEDIDFENRRITVRSSKGKDFRVVPMNKEVEDTLRFLKQNYFVQYSEDFYPREKHQREYVFCNEDGSKVLKITTAFRNAVKKVGLKNVTPHTLRHTFASHLVMAGVDLRTVQRYLGHKSITTTMMYSHLTQEHLASGVEKLPWLD